MGPTVYIETTVISYMAARPSRDLIVAAHQQLTHEWWREVLPRMEPVVSTAVLAEIRRGDPDQARERATLIAEFPVVAVDAEVEALAEAYHEALSIPASAFVDAVHLAAAISYEVDYLVTWNCRHLASARVRRLVDRMTGRAEASAPVICTPEELMDI